MVTILNNGVKMPMIGFGVYQIDPSETERCVCDAVETGYRSIDTAAVYLNEAEVGAAIRHCGVPREELFITTKLWVQDAGYDAAKKAAEESLRKLGIEYFDLYLVHQPIRDYFGAWRALEELYREGKTCAIGVANFYPDHLANLMLCAEVTPQVNQIETHPYFQRTADHAFMQERKVQHESWGPFAEGRNNLFSDPVLSAVAVKHGKSIAQVVLRWLLQRGVVVIPKSVHKERMVQNFDVLSFELDDDDMATIARLDTGKSAFFDHHDGKIVQWIGEMKIH